MRGLVEVFMSTRIERSLLLRRFQKNVGLKGIHSNWCNGVLVDGKALLYLDSFFRIQNSFRGQLQDVIPRSSKK